MEKKKQKLIRIFLKEIEDAVDLLNKILNEPYLYSNDRQAVMAAINIRCRAESIESCLYPQGLKPCARIDETWTEETQAPQGHKNPGVLRLTDVEE